MTGRRFTALLALALAVVCIALAAFTAVDRFPRGLIVFGCILVALAAGWYGALRRGVLRVIGWAVAVAAVAAGLILLVTNDPLVMAAVVVAAVAALALARAAFSSHAHLPTAPSPSRPVLFVNPRSGGGKAQHVHLAEQARERGIEVVELTPGATLESLIDAALARGADALAMAGGDGSQAIVAAAAAREGLPYACIPTGTRNHFALDLGVDRDDPVGALDAFVGGGERRVDLAKVNGRVFVNNVSLGLYAEAVQHSSYRGAKLRTLLDTVPDVAGPSAQLPPIRWSGSDQVPKSGGLALLISNNPYRLGRAVGSGTRPRMDTGRLGVAVIGRRAGDDGGLLRLSTEPTVEVDSEQPVAAGIDGESAMLDVPVRFEIVPGALRVRIAARHPGQSPSAAIPQGPWTSLGALARVAFSRTSEAAGPRAS
jgi:diacylglycerol kinase family enzyme